VVCKALKVFSIKNKRVRQLEEANQMCVLCDEAITNPICLDCLEKSMEQWAEAIKPAIVNGLAEKAWLFKSYTHEGTKCVVCGNNINICAHCFCKDIYEWLQKEYSETTESFLVCFNYEIRSLCRF